MQACGPHLRRPIVLRADSRQEGRPKWERFCVACDDWVLLKRFRGFLPYCLQHDEGKSLRGAIPRVPERTQWQNFAIRARPVCKTLVAGMNKQSPHATPMFCDTGCGHHAIQGLGLCRNCVQVCAHLHPLVQWHCVKCATFHLVRFE